ncbi:MAG: hypothetical protein F6K31_27160 [Symploca sp. SIO2G7]|nr:hypothetical protein [Symploca sp. SIO2G7]
MGIGDKLSDRLRAPTGGALPPKNERNFCQILFLSSFLPFFPVACCLLPVACCLVS